MKSARLHRFPPLAQVAARGRLQEGAPAQVQASLAEGFQEALDKGFQQGYRDGYDNGLESGRREGAQQGQTEGSAQGLRDAQARFESLTQPVDAMLSALKQLQADYQSALRKEMVDLVGKVARQVIRCELALQPVQLLALVDETLASMPPVADGVEVYLNPEELQRIRELDPARAERWTLIPDPRLEAGECRVKAGDREADAGCRQRLAACIEQISQQLASDAGEVAA